MKSRNREVNIFNMSLLDILCGALGAFCFMMLSLLPYYHPPGEDYKKVTEEQQKLLEEIKDIKDLAERLKFTSNAEDQRELVKQLQEMIQKLENRIKALQGQVNGLMAENAELKKDVEKLTREKEELLAENRMLERENDRLEGEKQQLEKENEKLQKENDFYKETWERRTPWSIVMTSSMSAQRIVASLHEHKLGLKDGGKATEFDPKKGGGQGRMSGDDFFSTANSFVLVQADRVPGSEQRLYVKSEGFMSAMGGCAVTGYAGGHNMATQTIPGITLTTQRPWIFVGTFMTGNDRVPKFVVATDQEREAEWKRLEPPPPPPPTERPKPPPGPTPPGPAPTPPLTREQSEELVRRRLTAQRMAEDTGARLGLGGADQREALGRVKQFAAQVINAPNMGIKHAIMDQAMKDAQSDLEKRAIQELFGRLISIPPLQPGTSSGDGRVPPPFGRREVPPRPAPSGPAAPFGANPGPGGQTPPAPVAPTPPASPPSGPPGPAQPSPTPK